MINSKNAREFLCKYVNKDGYDIVLDLKKSQGLWLYDSKHGRKLLDFFGFFATSPLGMNHPKMFEKSFLEELKYASINKVTNSDVYTVEMASFLEEFIKTAPAYMRHFFFIEGGALAVENALKASFDWKIRKNLSKGQKKEIGTKVIHLKEAFHGRSGYTLSLTNTFDANKTKYYPKFDWPRVTNPKITFPLNKQHLESVKALERKSLDEIQDAIDRYNDDLAALIIEPIQGEGGDNHFREEYFKSLREITSKNDIMFIVDEVQSGMGITGRWWAIQNFGVEPDFIIFGKKLQVCGIMAGPKIEEVKENVFDVSGRINSTWGGNIADMVRGKRYIEIINEENIMDNVNKSGEYMLKRLGDLAREHPSFFSNPRGRGLMCAIDVKDAKTRDLYTAEVFKKGLLVLKCGERSIRFRPPLVIKKEEIDAGFNLLEKAIT